MVDGSVIAQLGVTDMRHPIQYALTYPERRPSAQAGLDITSLSKLEFEEPDLERFPCLGLAYEALRAGGTMPAVLNAANEVAVKAFLDGEISLPQIAEIVAGVMKEHIPLPATDIETILKADSDARTAAAGVIAASTSQAAVTEFV